jgi:hypothetical protein
MKLGRMVTERLNHATEKANKYTWGPPALKCRFHTSSILRELFRRPSIQSLVRNIKINLILSTRFKYQTNHAFPLPHRLGGRGRHGLCQPYGIQAQP